MLQRTFRFTQRDAKLRTERGRETVDTPGEKRPFGAVPQLRGVFGPRTRMRQTLAVTRHSLVEVMSGRAFPGAFLAAIGLVVLLGWNVLTELREKKVL